MVERCPDKTEVGGPIPPPPTNVVNRDCPDKTEVLGPIPSAPTNTVMCTLPCQYTILTLLLIQYIIKQSGCSLQANPNQARRCGMNPLIETIAIFVVLFSLAELIVSILLVIGILVYFSGGDQYWNY